MAITEQNKDTSLQLKELALGLHNISLSMRVQYRTLSSLAFAEVFCLVIILLLFLFGSRTLRDLNSIILAAILLVIVDIIAIIIYVRLRRNEMSFRKKYQEGRGILKIMADKAEWTNYKKKLIYRGNEEKTSSAVDAFFSVSEKMWSPCRSEKRYYAILVFVFPPFVAGAFLAFIVKAFLGA